MDWSPAILRTLTYFDLFDYPLTLQELRSGLIADHPEELPTQPPMLSELMDQINRISIIGQKNGFYLLQTKKNIDQLISQRIRRYDIAEQKWQILIPKIRRLAALPFVRAIFVVNTLSWSNAAEDSDIDLVVVAKPQHLWTCRQFVTGFTALRRDRPSARRHADTLCLSMYVANDALDFSRITMGTDDMHLAMWLGQFHPVYDPAHLLEILWEQNPWARHRLPYLFLNQPGDRRRLTLRRPTRIFKSISETVLSSAFIESMCKKFQWHVLPPHLKRLANQSPAVVISDSMLKFHDKDPRERLNQQWRQRIQQFEQTSGAV